MDQIDRLKSLLRNYRDKQCLLFVGAGFSANAKSKDLEGKAQFLPSARHLADYMSVKLGESGSDLMTLSSLYEDENGEHGLFQLLKTFFVAHEVTNTQKIISSFQWKQIYTTNYDNVIDTCLSELGVKHSIHTTTKRPSEVDHRTLPVIHINGYIQSSTFSDFKKEIKLTDSHYFSDDFSRSAWGERFRNDILTAPCVIFAGYSLYDLDVARVINSFEGINERIYFVVSKNPSRSLVKKLEGFGRILPIGVDELANAIAEVLSDPIQPSHKNLSGWEIIQVPQNPPKPLRDIDVINYLMSGNIDEGQFASDILSSKYDFTVNRDISDYIVENISKNFFKNVLISSNTGNGKTETLKAIGYKLAARGFNVFLASSRPVILLKEISILKDKAGKIALIVDDIFSNIDVVRAIISLGREDIYILASSRTSQAQLQENTVQILFNNEIDIFNIDTLTEVEEDQCVRIFDKYALWGTRQPETFEQKKRFISKNCSGELRFLVLEALDSPNIRQRIQNIMNVSGNASEQDRVRTILIISQLLNLAQISSDLSLISEIAGFDARRAIGNHANSLKDFTLIRNGKISIKSSVFSEYVIKKLIDTSFVIYTMIESMRELDDLHDNDVQYANIYKAFSRFIFVEQTIAKEKRLIHMVNYFEHIKDFTHSRRHPLFWLQYAMCRMSLDQYGEAKRLFDVSFALSKAAGYRENRHQNNQWARFLIESRTNSNEYTDFMAAFNEAHGICIRQMNDDPLGHAPYRVAQTYLAFLERRISDLVTGDLVSLVRSAGEILRKINNKNANLSHTSVRQCADNMNKITSIAKARLKELGVTM